MLHTGQHPPQIVEQYHPQVSSIFVRQAQPMLSDVGEQKHDVLALPFPQPGMSVYPQQPMEHTQHNLDDSNLERGVSMGHQPQSGSGSEFPSHSPEGALLPGENSRK